MTERNPSHQAFISPETGSLGRPPIIDMLRQLNDQLLMDRFLDGLSPHLEAVYADQENSSIALAEYLYHIATEASVLESAGGVEAYRELQQALDNGENTEPAVAAAHWLVDRPPQLPVPVTYSQLMTADELITALEERLDSRLS